MRSWFKKGQLPHLAKMNHLSLFLFDNKSCSKFSTLLQNTKVTSWAPGKKQSKLKLHQVLLCSIFQKAIFLFICESALRFLRHDLTVITPLSKCSYIWLHMETFCSEMVERANHVRRIACLQEGFTHIFTPL